MAFWERKSSIFVGFSSWLPSWFTVVWRRLRVILNLGVVVYLIRAAELEGVGLEVALQWAVIGGVLANVSLLWRVLFRLRATAPHLSLQTLGLSTVCWWGRFLGISRWSMEAIGPAVYQKSIAEGVTAVLSTFTFIVTYREHQRVSSAEAVGADGPLHPPPPFASELLRRYCALPVAGTQTGKVIASFVEYLVLPALLFAIAVVIHLVATPEALRRRDMDEGRRWPFLATWHETMEAAALLPQFQRLHATRTAATKTISGVGENGNVEHVDGQVVHVPQELAYWLASLGFGHFFGFLTAFADSWSASGSGKIGMAYACGEACNTAVLGELLLAHFSAKWSGKRDLVLPA